MKGWLQKIGLPAKQQTNRSVQARSASNNLPAQPTPPPVALPQSLPNATIIYGIGASLMFVAAFFLLLSARFFPAFAVFVIGLCLTGFALHLLKHQD